MNRINFIILCFFLLLNLKPEAQIISNDRFQRAHKYTESDFTVFTAKEEGLVAFRKTDKYEKMKPLWEILILDTLLETRFEYKIALDGNYELLGYDVNHGKFCLLFRDGMNEKGDFALLDIDLNQQFYKIHEIQNEIEIDLSHFILTKFNIVLGGTVVDRPAIIHYNMIEEKVKVLPGLFRKENELVDIVANKNGTFNIVFLENERDRYVQKITNRVYSPTGDQLVESSAEFPEKIRIHMGTSNQLEGKNLILAGTYGEKNSKVSQGIFFVDLRPGDQNKVKLIEYTALNNFFNHLGERRAAKIKEKINSSDTSDPYQFKTHFNIWDLQELDGKYYIFGEIIDPEYASSATHNYRTATPYDAQPYYNNFDRFGTWGRYYSTSHSMVNRDEIVNVEYESGVIICLNKSGNIINDFSGVFDNMDNGTLEQLSSFSIYDNKYSIAYKKEEELMLSQFDLLTSEKSDSIIEIVSPVKGVYVKDESAEGKIEHWYNNVFYIWGYERILDTSANDRERVFYINKIRMD